MSAAVTLGTGLRARMGPGFGLFGQRAFLYFWVGNFMAFGCRELWVLAQSWLILDLSDSQAWVGAATGLAALPAVVLGLYSGYVADRWGARAVLLITRAALVLLAAVIAALAVSGAATVWQVVLLGVLMGSFIAVSSSAMQTMVTSLVPRERLQPANALNQMTFGMARAMGPLLGGYLIAVFEIGAAFIAVLAICITGFFATYMIPVAGRPDTPIRSGVFTQVREGLAYVMGNSAVKWTLFIVFMAMFAVTVMPLVSVYAKDVLKVGETGFAWLFGAFALGQVLAGLFVTAVGGFRRHGLIMVLVGLQWAIAMVVFAYSRSYPLSLAAMFFMGITNTVWFTSVVTLIQTNTDRDKLGRVMGLFGITVQTAIGGWALGGWLGELIGNELMIVLSACILGGSYLLAYVMSKPLRAQ